MKIIIKGAVAVEDGEKVTLHCSISYTWNGAMGN